MRKNFNLTLVFILFFWGTFSFAEGENVGLEEQEHWVRIVSSNSSTPEQRSRGYLKLAKIELKRGDLEGALGLLQSALDRGYPFDLTAQSALARIYQALYLRTHDERSKLQAILHYESLLLMRPQQVSEKDRPFLKSHQASACVELHQLGYWNANDKAGVGTCVIYS